MEIFLLAILILYFSEHLLLFTGLLKNLKKPAPSSGNCLYSVSVIVAAKNEEKCIRECIESLLRLEYPQEKLEILLVNDRSTDNTGEIMSCYEQVNKSVKYIEIKEINGKLKGKTNALAESIKHAKGELIFTTDADIEVKPTWIKEMVKYYDDKTGLVSSYSIIKPKNFFKGIQSFDWLYLLSVASGADGINKNISCVGNNMSYRKKTYDDVGGYEKVKFSVTEDFMLLHTIRKETKWEAKFPAAPDAVNYTLACDTVKELYRQKKRWTIGGLDVKTPGIVVGVLAWITGVILLAGWLISLKFYLLFVVLKVLIDFLFVLPAALRLKEFKILPYIFLFEVYYALYVFLMPFVLLFDGEVVWKEQNFTQA